MKAAYPLALCALLAPMLAVAPAAHSQQNAPPAAAPSAAKEEPKTIAIEKGEIRLDGRITAMTGGTAFDIKAFSFTTQAGRTIEFDEARDKSIGGDEATKVYAGDDLGKALGWKVVKLGMRVAVIGRDAGSGKPLKARAIVLSDFSSKYVKGRSFSASAPVSLLLRRGEEAFDGGDYQRALTLFRQASGTAAGLGDQSGASLSLGNIGKVYKELNQPEKAIEAYQEALRIRDALGEAGASATLQNNLAMSLLDVGRRAEAVALLEKANETSNDESEEVSLVLGSNLGRAYLANRQWDRAVETYRDLTGRFGARGETEREVGALLAIARAHRGASKATESAASVAQARARIDAAAEAPRKAASQMLLGTWLAEVDDAGGARQAFNAALALFNDAGDARGAESARTALTKLDAAAAAGAAAPAAADAADAAGAE